MEQKPFAVGVRIEHRQREIDMAQYGRYAGHPALPPTAYKLSCHTSGGRGVFSFCVCPGGHRGGRRFGTGARGDQRHERIRPRRRKHQRRFSGGRRAAGFRQRRSPVGGSLSAPAGSGGLPPGRRQFYCTSPAGGGFFCPIGPPLDRGQCCHLPSRRTLDGPASVPAAFPVRSAGRSAAYAGKARDRLRRARTQY